jgi:hypothetical protein
MAEINVQRKTGPAPWLWLVVFLAVLVLAWLVLGLAGREERVGVAVPLSPAEPSPAATAIVPGGTAATPGVGGPPAAEAMPPAVEAFREYLRQEGAKPGRDHQYTAEGIRRLAGALQAMAGETAAEQDIREQLAQMREAAEQLQAEPDSSNHAGTARRAFETAAGVIARLAQAHPGTQGHVAPLREAVQDLTPEQPLLQQMPAVNQFFERAAEMMSHLARARGEGGQP